MDRGAVSGNSILDRKVLGSECMDYQIKEFLLSTYTVPNTILSAAHALTHLISQEPVREASLSSIIQVRRLDTERSSMSKLYS